MSLFNKNTKVTIMAEGSKSLGGALASLAFKVTAVLVSWYFNKSIFWGIIHFLFGFWYLLYMLITGEFNDGIITQIYDHYL